MPFSFIHHKNAEIENVDNISPEFNPYIHGTTTATIAWMSQTGWSLLSPIAMLDNHQLAPLTGELSKGGLNHVEDEGMTSFARLAGKPESNEYTLDDVINTYGKIEGALSTNLVKYDLEAAIKNAPQVLYSNINLILIHAARYKQLGGDLQENVLLKNAINQIKASIGIFYLYMILGDFLMPAAKPYEAFKGQIYDISADAILAHLNAVSLIKKIDEQTLDLQAIYENPTPENLNLVINLLELPKTSTFSQLSKPAKEHTLEHTIIAEIPSSEETPKLDLSEDFQKSHQDYIFSNKSTWTTEYLLWHYINGMRHPSYFRNAKSSLLPHISLLKKQRDLLINIINAPLKSVQFNEVEKNFIAKPFSIIFIYAANKKVELFSSTTEEYRATSALALAQDIHTVASDTEEHQKTLQQYFDDNALHINVILFKQLYQARKQLLEFAAPLITPPQVFKPTVTENSQNISLTNNKNFAPEIKEIIEKIKTHTYLCHGGGTPFEGKTYSHSALVILNLLNPHVNNHVSIETYKVIQQAVQKELEQKRVTTYGFFGIGSRDQTTVDLYNDLYDQMITSKLS